MVGKHGTIIFIPANSLVFDDGEQPTDQVNITLKEVYSISEMILNGLSTTSNGELLETSGMINLQATSNNKTLKLKTGSPIKIQFRNIASSPFMRTYLGQEDSTGINWNLDQNNIYDTLKFDESKQYIKTLAYGADLLFSATITYGVVANDTFELKRTIWENIDVDSDSAYYDEATSVNKAPFFTIHSTELNWINCDFFIYSDEHINVKTNQYPDAFTQNYLIFHDYKSIMSSGHLVDKHMLFENIPRGSKVTAIGIAMKDSEIYFATREVDLLEENQQIPLQYQKFSLENLTNQLEKLE